MAHDPQQSLFKAESIELFIEDKAFSPSYDLPPPPPLISPSYCVSLVELTDGRGGGGGGESNHTTVRERVESSINHSIAVLSGLKKIGSNPSQIPRNNYYYFHC